MSTPMQQLLEAWARDPQAFDDGPVAFAPFDLERWQAARPALATARERVFGHAAVALMRRVSRWLHDAAEPFVGRADQINADPTLSDTGRGQAFGQLREDLQAALDQVARSFDQLAQRLLDDFPVPPPRQFSAADAPRLTVAVTRAPHLSVEELERELRTAIERRDVPLLEALLPLGRSRGASGSEGSVTAARLDLATLDELVARAEGALLTEGEAAHVVAGALVERLRAERDGVIHELLVAGGDWQKSIQLRLVDNEGRPAAFRELEPVAVEYGPGRL